MKEQTNVQDENIENKENIDIEQKDGQTSQDETSEDQWSDTLDNLKKALAKQRAELKKYKGIDPDEYKNLVKEKQSLEEKEKLKKWKYEEIINDYKSKLEETEKYKSFYEANVQREEWKLEWLLQNVPQEKKGFVEKIIWKAENVFEKVELLNELIPTFQKQDFIANPWSEGRQKTKMSLLSISDFQSLSRSDKESYMESSKKEHWEVKFI